MSRPVTTQITIAELEAHVRQLLLDLADRDVLLARMRVQLAEDRAEQSGLAAALDRARQDLAVETADNSALRRQRTLLVARVAELEQTVAVVEAGLPASGPIPLVPVDRVTGLPQRRPLHLAWGARNVQGRPSC